MDLKYSIDGGKELSDALRRMSIQLERKVAKEAVREGAKLITAEAKRRAPVKTGTLRRSIQAVARSRRMGDALMSIVTRQGRKYRARRMDAWYAHLIEFGSKRRPATPFLRPALDSQRFKVERVMSEAIMKAIRRMAAGFRTKRAAKKAGFE